MQRDHEPDSSQPDLPAAPRRRARTALLIATMFLAVLAVGALAYWDKMRDMAATFDELAQDQATFAATVASHLTTQLAVVRRDATLFADDARAGRVTSPRVTAEYAWMKLRSPGAPASAPSEGDITLSVPVAPDETVDVALSMSALLHDLSPANRPAMTALFVRPPGSADFRAADGHAIVAPALADAFATGAPSAWLMREEATEIGLMPARAAVGLARVDVLGTWGIAVTSSALNLRVRERRSIARLVLSILLAGGLVFAFGSVAIAKQRRELDLERDLAVSEIERQRDVRLARASRAATMGTLAMGIAHEVSTPLGIIAGRSEQLLPRVTGDDRSERCVNAILEQVERIRATVRGFLHLARGGAPALGEARPDLVLERAVALVEHRFAKAGVRLAADIPEPLPAVRCDRSMLEQAIVNLLLNACDACEAGCTVRATIRASGGRVVFEVADDGAGITREEAARATEPFFTTKPAGEGMGLGLAISNEIVKLHRGALEIGPAEPRGTLARVSLPAPEAAS